MATILILLVIVAIIAGLLWMVRGKQSPTRRRVTNLHKYDPANASEDEPGCEAAQAILGKQFTFAEAPQLPLEGCDSAMCTCQFKGLQNKRTRRRRKLEDRRVEVRFEKDKPDRRSRKDRRRGDKWDDHTL